MKKIVLIIALGAFTIAGVQAIGNIDPSETMYVELAQDKAEIAPEDLPQPVKDTIEEGEDTRYLEISKAYQSTDEEGNVHYKVVFGEGDDAITKKYDAEGNEVEKGDKKKGERGNPEGNPDPEGNSDPM